VYPTSDPRGALSPTGDHAAGAVPAASFLEFGGRPPSEVSSGLTTWFARSRDLFIAYSIADAATTLPALTETGEHVALVFDAEFELDGQRGVDDSFVSIPAPTAIALGAPARVLRLFTSVPDELASRALNSADFSTPIADVPSAPVTSVDGLVRIRSLAVPPVDGRFGRIFSSARLMVNVMYPTMGPRSSDELSPHSHSDFEQCSISLEGDFVHHLRWPWNHRLTDWRDDLHQTVSSPSLAAIPAGVIHTSPAVGEGTHLLIDAFTPPRADFAAMPGWVLNATDLTESE